MYERRGYEPSRDLELDAAVSADAQAERAAKLADYLRHRSSGPGSVFLETSVTEQTIRQLVRNFLVRRLPEAQEEKGRVELKKRYQADYRAHVNRMVDCLKKSGLRVVDKADNFWVGISFPENKQAMPLPSLRSDAGQKIDVYFKSYFTVTQLADSIEMIRAKANAVLDFIPHLASSLERVQAQARDQIAMKFSSKLDYYATHADQLVMHYRRLETSDNIAAAVEPYLKVFGPTGRVGRTQTGFDFELHDEHSYLEGSHTELIGQAVAELVMQDLASGRSKLANLDPQEMNRWLREETAHFASLSPDGLLRFLQDHKMNYKE